MKKNKIYQKEGEEVIQLINSPNKNMQQKLEIIKKKNYWLVLRWVTDLKETWLNSDRGGYFVISVHSYSGLGKVQMMIQWYFPENEMESRD